MKKKILLLSGAALGATLFYLFNRRRQETAANGVDFKSNARAVRKSEDAATKFRAPKRKPRTQDARVKSADGPAAERLFVDDLGTDQITAASLLRTIRDLAFDSSDEKLALALGRPVAEIQSWTNGLGTIDGDVVMKARRLALGRGFAIE